MSDTLLPEDDELLAAELAFGLIDGAEKRAAEAMLATDEAFAHAHSRWQEYAAAMFQYAGEAPALRCGVHRGTPAGQ
jgi:anti-sigma-K factor RskA